MRKELIVTASLVALAMASPAAPAVGQDAEPAGPSEVAGLAPTPASSTLAAGTPSLPQKRGRGRGMAASIPHSGGLCPADGIHEVTEYSTIRNSGTRTSR